MKVIVITSIAHDSNPILKHIADECLVQNLPFVLIGDTKSPDKFDLKGCDFYSLSRQQKLPFQLVSITPQRHYSRKNVGYLIAMKLGATEIQETDDDNIPLYDFWKDSSLTIRGKAVRDQGWINVYSHFSKTQVWPRGFPLEFLKMKAPMIDASLTEHLCPIQQGLANENPDVDAVFRLVGGLPIDFDNHHPLILLNNSWCPFNSQNTRWYEEAFPLLYLPSYCSFRMTDIWRSYIAQRIAWECNWGILFHQATVRQERNEHNLLKDFEEEIPGYLNNARIVKALSELVLKKGKESMYPNLITCYEKMIELGVVDLKELQLLDAWITDCENVSGTE